MEEAEGRIDAATETSARNRTTHFRSCEGTR